MLDVQNVSVERGGYPLFQPVSIQLSAGALVQVVGPNGSGKTSLLLTVAGLLPLTAGRLCWFGEDMHSCRSEFSQSMSYLGHAAGLKSAMNPMENLEFLLSLRQKKLQKKVLLDALAMLGLRGYERTPVAHLSAGQRRRVALARLYLEQTSLWLLDEPFTAIDLSGVEQLEYLVHDHAVGGGMVLFTTHHQMRDQSRLQALALVPVVGASYELETV